MKLEWVVIADSGISHAFSEETRKSLCGLKFPRQLVLPFNLPEPPKNTHCSRCDLYVEKREAKEAA